MPAINTGTYRTLRLGGVFRITDKETTTMFDDILGMEAGSVLVRPGMRQLARDRNGRGTLVTSARLLDQQVTELQFAFAHTDFAASGLYALLSDQEPATMTGLARAFLIEWRSSAGVGVAADRQISFDHCYVDTGGIEIAEGDDHDVVRVSMFSNVANPPLGNVT